MAFKTAHPWKPEPFTQVDRDFVCMVFGWICGFSYFVIWNAMRQTKRLSVYTWVMVLIFQSSTLTQGNSVLIWAEIIACGVFAFICLFYLIGVIAHSFAFFMAILTCWALQVQFLLQIIVNRICLLINEKKHKILLKGGVAALITAVNIAVYCIWIPARLQINDTYVHVNEIWDRTEKCIYLVVDAWLNWLFIRTVNKRLLSHGLDRYRPLVRFNTRIIWVSLSMDCLIISMMSYPNSFVYMMFHPLAYMVKLNIEMSMSELMVSIVTAKRKTGPLSFDHGDALQVAVHTHVETTAIQLDPLDSKDKLRTTRTPARPDLAERLARMRKEKKEREERAAYGNHGDAWDEKEDDLDVKQEFDDWRTASRTTIAVPQPTRTRVQFDDNSYP